ncbi:hypothetical protein [Streptosporangium sp. 'caverna']|uniref:hypothetical protein n=1 Tax=Streptosporangium sp. 'caverna' TaxID=2202249 RepID=UPI000D7DF452|nr:hypothetical protein [Streptosporangium sp. 'caverna']AWS47360.1 hypothetical protein DKM19_44755 [Streptosporangium sp. 'caverna']
MSAVTRDVLVLGPADRFITARPTITERTAGARVAQIFATPGSHDSGLRHAGVARLAGFALPRPGGAYAHPRGPALDGSGRAV